ncbi:MAG: hypothetical protein PVG99_09460 [Desulfobacteraceae bacterium]
MPNQKVAFKARFDMVESKESRHKFRVIQGGLTDEISLGPLRLVAAPKHAPPFKVEAFAFEEDTFLVLSTNTRVRDPKARLPRIMTRLIDMQPEIPGTVLVRGKRPLRFLAIVHDLNQEPTWKEEWIERALDGLFQEAENRELHAIAIPLLGTRHGSLEKARFVVLLQRALERMSFNHLKRLWLIVPVGTARDIVGILGSEYQQQEKAVT